MNRASGLFAQALDPETAWQDRSRPELQAHEQLVYGIQRLYDLAMNAGIALNEGDVMVKREMLPALCEAMAIIAQTVPGIAYGTLPATDSKGLVALTTPPATGPPSAEAPRGGAPESYATVVATPEGQRSGHEWQAPHLSHGGGRGRAGGGNPGGRTGSTGGRGGRGGFTQDASQPRLGTRACKFFKVGVRCCNEGTLCTFVHPDADGNEIRTVSNETHHDGSVSSEEPSCECFPTMPRTRKDRPSSFGQLSPEETLLRDLRDDIAGRGDAAGRAGPAVAATADGRVPFKRQKNT